MTRLTVVQVLPALEAGGVERCTLETARALVAAGHRSVVVSSGGRLVEQLEREGSEHRLLPVKRKSLATLLQVGPMRRLLQELKPDILHARSRVPAWVAWLAWRKLPVADRPRFVTTVHGLHSVNFYSAIMARGEAVIAGSEIVRRYILDNYARQCPADRIHLIPEGVDPLEFPYDYQPAPEWVARWRADFPELAGKTVLALPGRLTRLKGHATFIGLIQALADHPEVHGLIAGGAEARKAAYADELRAAVDAAGLSSRITFSGQRGDMRDVLSQCDAVFALSTQPETFGRIVMESIRLGRPVIGWDEGGVGDILARCYPQGRVPPGDTAALEAATRRWLATRDRPAPSQEFLLATMCDRTLALYESLAAARPKAVPA